MNRTIDEIQKAIAEKQETLARLENKFGGRFPAHEKEIEFLFEELHRLKVHDRNVWEADTRKRAALTADIPFDRLRELVEADKDGRCVVLPFPEGTEMYEVRTIFGEPRLKSFTFGRGFSVYATEAIVEQMGKTVFLARAEAEEALKGGTA